MIVYYSLFFMIAALAFLCHKKNTHKYLVLFFVASLVLLSLVEGLRAYDVGYDTLDYVKWFTGEDPFRAEIGYEIFEGIVKVFTSNPTVFLVVIALFVNGIILAAIYFNSHTPIASVLLYILMYYYFNTFDVTRQYIAVGVTLFAFHFAVRHRWISFVLMVALSMCFHNTAMVCFVLAAAGFVYGEDDSALQSESSDTAVQRKKALLIQTLVVALTVIASLVCYFFLDEIIAVAVWIFPKYRSYLIGPQSNLLTDGGGISQPVVYTSILLALLIFVPDENKYKRKLLVPACVAVMFSFLQMRVLHAARFLSYFDIYSVFTIPCILKYGNFPERLRKVFIVMTALVCFAFMSYYLMQGYHGVKNYSFVFVS